MLLQVQSVIEINVANDASDSDRQQQAADDEDVDVHLVSRSEPDHAADERQQENDHEFDLLADDDGIGTDTEDKKVEFDDDEVVFLGWF